MIRFMKRLILVAGIGLFATWLSLYINLLIHIVEPKVIAGRYQIDTWKTTERSLETIPTIYVVTPTHKRLEQKADLTRLSYTLRLVPILHWILVEDSKTKTALVSTLLKMSKLSYTHLNVITPNNMIKNAHGSRLKHPRGVAQRNAGISWIRKNVQTPGVVYFADDDNTYDIRLFEEMRYTRKVSVWPVGLVARQMYASPQVRNGKVVGWLTTFDRNRTFGTDMAGFAINVQLIHNTTTLQFRNKLYHLETDLLSQLNITLKDLEPRADNCTKVLVWHTRTAESSLQNEKNFQKLYKNNITHTMEV